MFRRAVLVAAACLLFGTGPLVLSAPPAAAQDAMLAESAVCPVTGKRIPDTSRWPHRSTYKGKTYYFADEGAKALFDKDPEKYLRGRR